jgi:hypothetical protein
MSICRYILPSAVGLMSHMPLYEQLGTNSETVRKFLWSICPYQNFYGYSSSARTPFHDVTV